MQAPLSRYPLLPVVAGIVSGILISRWDISLSWTIIPIVAGVFLFIYRPLAYLGIILLSMTAGWIDGTLSRPQFPVGVIAGHSLYYHGVVNDLRDNETSSQLTVSVDSVGYSRTGMTRCREFSALLYMPGMPDSIDYGTEILFNATLELPVNDTHPDAFDLTTFLHDKGIVTTSFITPDRLLVTGRDTSPLYRIRTLPHRLESILFRTGLSQPCARFLCAILFGDTGMIDDDTRLQYTTAGVSHILALSGLHVAIITTIISALLFPLHLMRRRGIARFITIIMLWLYAVMTGLSPSVTRAVIMATLYFTSLTLQRKPSPGNALAFAAICILIVQPLRLFDISFQMTFVAVGTILLFANKLTISAKSHPIAQYLSSIPAVSVAAMAGTAIVAAYRFHHFPVYFLLGNVLTSLLLPPIIGGGIILLIVESVGLPSGLLCDIINRLFLWLDSLTKAINSLPGAAIDNIYFDGWLLLPYFISLLLIALSFRLRRKILPVVSGCLLLAFTLSAAAISYANTDGHEILILKDTYFTNIVCRAGNEAVLLTTAPPHDRAAQLAVSRRRLRDYLGRRGCDSLVLYGNHQLPEGFGIAGDIISFGNKSICVAAFDTIRIPEQLTPDYLLVTRGYKGNITSLHSSLRPDSLLLGNDLHPWRHDRYADSCAAHAIPFRSLKGDGCFYVRF
ncbi:MAG: ComEC family competence protein [Pseudoflavonifractor sp.]|nr:ComEC family competence protein [Pseudoflavonifractor sp.]